MLTIGGGLIEEKTGLRQDIVTTTYQQPVSFITVAVI